MLYFQNKTKLLMRCKYLNFMIPLGGGLTLLFILALSIAMPWDNNFTVYATDNTHSYQSSSPTISLTYSGSDELSNTGTINEGESNAIISIDKDISITGDLITSYNLQISSNTNSTILEGTTTINPIDNIANPNGIIATNMLDNTWGYSWNNGTNYKGITTTPTTIESTNLSSANNYSINTTKKLSFLAKFNKNAQSGHYKTSVKLLLTATPKALVTYTLAYNNNGGGTVPSSQSTTSYDDSKQFTISSTKPTRSGYEFAGYATTSAGSVAYQPGGIITITNPDPTTTNPTASITTTLYAKWNQIYTRTLSYSANNGTGAPGSQSCSSTSASCNVTISSTKPTRSGYIFLGWSTSSSTTIASYQPGGSISLSSNQTLYAVWEFDPWANITTMQQMTSSACSAATAGKTKTLTDDRTYPSGVSKTYTVRKMEDGKCWMTQNLRITGSSLNSFNSDVSSNYNLPASSASGFISETAQDAYYDSGKDTGYYTWCAATAGCKTSSGVNPGNGDNATSSICPKGWTLPTGYVTGTNITNDFYNLFKNMGLSISGSLSSTSSTSWGAGDLAIVQGSPYNFAYTGCMYNGSLGFATNGYWWSRTASSDTHAYALLVSGSSVNPGIFSTYKLNPNRLNGYAVRCIAE